MQTDNNQGKVVSLFGRAKEAPAKAEKNEETQEDYDFEAIMKRNADNRNRLSKDRKKANRGVVRSYRLKH